MISEQHYDHNNDKDEDHAVEHSEKKWGPSLSHNHPFEGLYSYTGSDWSSVLKRWWELSS